mmetsp:Transcript_12095/g.32560  ORF Transcript_12095/g.32560 Transcript_12095/m.32560 type:complete len:128 (-) Transcript_12095:1309-1692(-)
MSGAMLSLRLAEVMRRLSAVRTEQARLWPLGVRLEWAYAGSAVSERNNGGADGANEVQRAGDKDCSTAILDAVRTACAARETKRQLPSGARLSFEMQRWRWQVALPDFLHRACSFFKEAVRGQVGAL